MTLEAEAGPPVRVLLVDDHPLVRDGIRMRLEAACGILVVGEASDTDEALQRVEQTEPDIVVTDLRMPGRSGLTLTDALARQHPEVRIVVLSMLKDAEYVHRALALGAKAYVLKDAPAGELVQAIAAVAGGEGYLSSGLHAAVQVHRPAMLPRKPLTARESAILKLLAEGLPSKEIAARLGMSVRTVETHRLHLRRKLHIDAGTPLARYAADFSDLAEGHLEATRPGCAAGS